MTHYAVFKVRRLKRFLIFCKEYGNALAFSIPFTGGDKEIRTLDPLLARQVLSQLSYTPLGKP